MIDAAEAEMTTEIAVVLIQNTNGATPKTFATDMVLAAVGQAEAAPAAVGNCAEMAKVNSYMFFASAIRADPPPA